MEGKMRKLGVGLGGVGRPKGKLRSRDFPGKAIPSACTWLGLFRDDSAEFCRLGAFGIIYQSGL